MIDFLRIIFISCALIGVNACSSLPGTDGFGSRSEDFAAGSRLSTLLTTRDRDGLAKAMVIAVESGEQKPWRGPTATGVVMPHGYALAGLKSNETIRLGAARSDFDLNHVMETELGAYVLTRNSNLRTGPGTDRSIIEVLPSGTGVDLVGALINLEWGLIAIDGQVRGFVHRNLLVKAPGTELELAGGPQRRAVLCREFTQRMRVNDQIDEWEGAACQSLNGWALAPEPSAFNASF